MSLRITGRPIAIASSAALENDSTAVDGNTKTSSAVSTGRTSSSFTDERHAIRDLELGRATFQVSRAEVRRRR